MRRIISLTILLLQFFSLFAQPGTSPYLPQNREEARFFLQKYKETVPAYLRGMSVEEWDEREKTFLDAVDTCTSRRSYYFSYRFFSALINDQHSEFPDDGFYNRNRIFQKGDLLFPVWAKIWHDGRVFVEKDYSAKIRENAEIISVNGHNIITISLKLQQLCPAEDRYVFPNMNEREGPDIRSWRNLQNYFFFEGITAPFNVRYRLWGEDSVRSVTLPAFTRDSLFLLYKKSGDKRRVNRQIAYKQKPVQYRQVEEKTGVLKINSFWGRNIISFFIRGKDTRYERLLKKAMTQIARSQIKDLIIDIRGNPGGYDGNVAKTLDYLVDSFPVDREIYSVTKETRERIVPLLKDKYKTYCPDDWKVKLDAALRELEKMPEHSLFSPGLDSSLMHISPLTKYKYQNNLYLLSDAGSYSAAIVFCDKIQKLNRGLLAGGPPGGYIQVNGGPTVAFRGPYSKIIMMNPAFSSRINETNANSGYLKTDIVMEQSIGAWLNKKDDWIEQLVEMIKSRKIQDQLSDDGSWEQYKTGQLSLEELLRQANTFH